MNNRLILNTNPAILTPYQGSGCLREEAHVFGEYQRLLDGARQFVQREFPEDFSRVFSFERTDIRISTEPIRSTFGKWDEETLLGDIQALMEEIESSAMLDSWLQNEMLRVLRMLRELVLEESDLSPEFDLWDDLSHHLMEIRSMMGEVKRTADLSEDEEYEQSDVYNEMLALAEKCRNKKHSSKLFGDFRISEKSDFSVITMYSKTIEQQSSSDEEKDCRKKTVFTHELFHAMHYYYLLSDTKRFGNDCRKLYRYWTRGGATGEKSRTVKEALADSFACAVCQELGRTDPNYERISWDLKSSWYRRSYPGWPYAGAKALFDHDQLKTPIFMDVLGTSRTSWAKAYMILEEADRRKTVR